MGASVTRRFRPAGPPHRVVSRPRGCICNSLMNRFPDPSTYILRPHGCICNGESGISPCLFRDRVGASVTSLTVSRASSPCLFRDLAGASVTGGLPIPMRRVAVLKPDGCICNFVGPFVSARQPRWFRDLMGASVTRSRNPSRSRLSRGFRDFMGCICNPRRIRTHTHLYSPAGTPPHRWRNRLTPGGLPPL